MEESHSRMATNATNDIESPKDDLVDAENSDKPTNIEQNGENVQNPASEQGFENNTNGTNIEAQTDSIDNNAQNLEQENVEIEDSQSLSTRPKRQTKPSLKSVQNRMQTEQSKATKLWDRVQTEVTMLQTTPDSLSQIRLALSKVRAAFHDYQTLLVSYLDYLVHVGSGECMEKREKVEHILNNHKHYVDAVISEGNERKKELMAEISSARSSSRASSVSSAALRAQARGEAAAAIKKVELQKKRTEVESKLALQVQEYELALSRQNINEKARLEQLRLEEEAAVAVAKVTAIEDELGISDPREIDLPEENVDQRVNDYLENQCDFTPDNINIMEQPRTNNIQVSLPPSQSILQSQPQQSIAQPQHPTTQPQQSIAQPQHPTTQPQQSIGQPQHPITQPKQSIVQTQHPIVQPPQPLDPTTSAFYPPNQTSPPSNPNQDSMEPYINFMARRELIANKIEKFDDQPGNYHVWKESFQNMIRHVKITASEELSLISEYTTKNSKRLVQQLRSAYIRNPAKGVKEIWKKLDERFGTSIVLTKAHLDKLTDFPKVGYKDPKKLQELGDLLLQLECAKSDGSLPGLRILDEAMYIKPVISKLPGDIQGRWQRHAFRYKTDHGVDYPPFEEFSKFVQNLALERNDPNLILEVPEKENQHPRNSGQRQRQSYRTQISDDEKSGRRNLTHDPIRWCALHEKPHPLAKCRAFRGKSLEERKNLLRKNRICFRCVASTTHLAKDCRHTVKCSQCQSDKHLAVMHVGKPPEPKEPEVQDQSVNEDQNSGPPSHGGENEATAKCTELCGNNHGGRSCSKICLANIYVTTNPAKKIRAYVVIDDQSNCSLAKPKLFDQLNIDSDISSYTLKTCAGKSKLQGRCTRNLVIESLDGRKSHKLPSVIECEAIPDGKEEIATPAVGRAHPHLREIANEIPELDPDADILLLVGRNVPQLHKVHESRNGKGASPWAQLLDLGWVILGKVCLDGAHQPDNVSSFRTHILPNGRPSILEPCPNVLIVNIPSGNNFESGRKEVFNGGCFDDGLAKNVFVRTENDD